MINEHQEKNMYIAAKIFTGLVALIHAYIMVLESVLWTSRGLKVFGMTLEYAETTRVLAANQGWYNGVLAVGLVASLLIKDSSASKALAYFVLGSIFILGIVGTVTTGKINIVFVQTVPASIALLLTYLADRSQ